MKSNQKKKGYVLAFVLILSFVMTTTIAATFTIVMKYMFIAKHDLQDSVSPETAYYQSQEVEHYAEL